MSSKKNSCLQTFIVFIIFIFFFYWSYHFYFSMMSYYEGEIVNLNVLKIDEKKISQNHKNYFATVSFEYKNERIVDTIQINQSDIDKNIIKLYYNEDFGYSSPDSKSTTIFVFSLVAFITIILAIILFYFIKNIIYLH